MVSSVAQKVEGNTHMIKTEGFYRSARLLSVHNGTNIMADWSRPIPKNNMGLETMLFASAMGHAVKSVPSLRKSHF